MKNKFKILPLGKYQLTILKNQLSYSPTSLEGVIGTVSEEFD